ncbi:MAG: cobalt ECF transporter T component CbiQ [Actinomycetes bacterium]|jgi:cobalt/nickel transport system permease protein|nr:MAG: cobalt ECF transporter T component CbiQ [Actinomycetota bacterium]
MGAGHAHALYVHEHSPLHHAVPAAKVAAVLLFVAAVAVTPPRQAWAFGVYAVILAIALAVGRITPKFFFLRLAGILPFVLLALIVPFVGSGERVDLGWVSLSREGLWAAFGIAAKAVLGAGAAIVLVGTTEVPAVLRGLRDLKVPAVLVAIAGFMVRYLELIAEELGRMRQAMTARGYEPRWLWQARPIAQAAGVTFVRAYERGERVHGAMLARGYDGEMPMLGHRSPTPAQWAAALAAPALAAAVAVIAMVTA